MAQVLNVGTLLDHGKYRIEKILGQGGFGITYLVTDLGLDKLRALKEFFPKDLCVRGETTSQVMCSNPNTAELAERLKAKFLKEAKNIANLDRHNGIVRIHTVFEENDTAYYVMDYIEGESLLSLVKREGPLPVDRAVEYIREVGEALEYVHSHHINHLDVKPANIMIRHEDDKAILIDFGLSKQYDSEGHQTSTTPTGISHGFAPMEQYSDGGVREFSPQTDVYSLAATLYFILTGEKPPQATYIAENGLDFPANFPAELMDAVSKAMSTQRKNRHESVRHFLDSLQQIDTSTPKEIKVEVVDTPPQTQTHKQQVKELAKDKEVKEQDKDAESTQINTTAVKAPKKSKRKKILIASFIILCLAIIGVVIALHINNNSGQNKVRSTNNEYYENETQEKESVAKDSNTDSTNNDIKNIETVTRKSDGTLIEKNSLEFKILNVSEHTAKVSNALKNIEESVIIPSQIEIDGETYDVKSIENGAFSDCRSLRNIVIPNSVTKIGDWAFSRCTNLTSIIIPNSVTSIGEYAFKDCISLKSITIPNSVTMIGLDAFICCERLEEVTIPARFEDRISDIFPKCPELKPLHYTGKSNEKVSAYVPQKPRGAK